MPATLTRSAFAQVMGVHKSQVTRWAQAGMPIEEDGTIEPKTAAEWVHGNVDPALRNHHSQFRKAKRRVAATADDGPPRPPCTEHLTEHWEVVSVMFLQALAYSVPRMAATMAVASGASLPVAYTLASTMAIGVMQEVGDLLEQSDFEAPPGCATWGEANMWQAEPMRAINWPKLAENAGVPVDLEAWAAYRSERMG